MKYRIGSFNMYKFQTYRSDEDIRKNLQKIADIIISEELDVVGLQEIFSETAMNRLLAHLGNSWKGYWGSPNSRTAQAAEGYAFIWNTKRMKLAENVTANGKRMFYPRIYNQYRIDRSKGQTALIRNPFYARFVPINRFLEIRLINVHIVFSNSNLDISLGDATVRRNEYDILVNSIFNKESDKRYGNNMPAYTFILGDYNLNLNRPWTKSPYVSEIVQIADGRYVKAVRTDQEEPTTLTRDVNNEYGGYANNYDHFSYDERRFEGIELESNRIDTVKKYYGGDFEKHKKEISDHVPIVMEIDL